MRRAVISQGKPASNGQLNVVGKPCEVMHLAATILSGNSEGLIADAILYVRDWVDRILLIDTGITDGTVAVAREAAGAKLIVERFAWCNDFALARNFALAKAAELGAAWALTVDTDERLSFPGFAMPEQLCAAVDADAAVLAWLAPCRDGSYAKERFIRVPTVLQWRGRTHEALCGAGPRQRRILPGVEFFEVRKTPEQFRAKLERDLQVLRDETRTQPDNPRWWYYLGQTLEELGEHRRAADAYQQCYELREGWAEQSAWACFRAATCWLRFGEWQQALEICALGLARQPQSPELAWLAGFCSFKLGHFANAVTWEEIAIGLGHFEGRAAGLDRISFRYLPGWYEGPYDVLRFAWRSLGQPQRAAECERKFVLAQAKRREHGTLRAEACRKPGPAVCPPARVAPNETGRVRVAVLGLYSSGSTAVAGMLHRLGVCLGKRFWGEYYEPWWLSQQLRRWWNEPDLREVVGRAERVRQLATWIGDLEASHPGAAGAKHPLLSLCGEDLRAAWGGDTKFVWAWRPLDESVASLQRRGWWPGKERDLQTRLWQAVRDFFAGQEHLQIVHADLLEHPQGEMQRMIEYLALSPSEQARRQAVDFIRQPAEG